jgi:molybdate transport repressor ModE-like protein
MLSWDDFRQVKAIADSGSLNAAAQALGINHSTAFRRLGQIEQRLGSRLFKRERTGYSLTPAGEEMVRLAERMEQDVASFARGQNGKPAHDPPAASGVVPAEPVMSQTGLEFLEAMVGGQIPQAPMAATLGFRIVDVSEGRAVFEGTPEFRLYNPIGTVHGGFAASLLDSALGCAIFSTLAKGESWTTLELKLNFVRAMSKDTGPVRAEGRIIHRGRTVATSEGTLKNREGTLYAHATTTCMIFPAKK